MPIPEKLQEFLEDLRLYPDRSDRIEALIAIGEEFHNPSDEELPRTPAQKVPGCESEVFVAATPSGQSLKFRFAVDNPQGISAMALAQILDQNLSGQPLEQVLQVAEEVVYDIFGRELSMGKSLGLMGMVKMVKHEAQKGLA